MGFDQTLQNSKKMFLFVSAYLLDYAVSWLELCVEQRSSSLCWQDAAKMYSTT